MIVIFTPSDGTEDLEWSVRGEDGDHDTVVEEQSLHEHPEDVADHCVLTQHDDQLTEPILERHRTKKYVKHKQTTNKQNKNSHSI